MRVKITLLIVALMSISPLSGCSSQDIDGKIVAIDGDVYELQHRLFNTYLLHKIDKAELDKFKTN